MPQNYDAIDTKYTWNGDYKIGPDGDLDDTSRDQIESLIQEIQTIVNSSEGDWEEHPQYAASIDEFIGEPNTRSTAERLANRIRTSLISNVVVAVADVSIRVVPVDRYRVMVVISVKAAATPNNSIIAGGPAVVVLIVDSVEHAIYFTDPLSGTI